MLRNISEARPFTGWPGADVSRNLIRIWVSKLEAGAFDEDVEAAGLLQEFEAKISAQQPRRQVWSLADAEAPVGAGGQGEKHRPLVAGAPPGAGRFSAPLV